MSGLIQLNAAPERNVAAPYSVASAAASSPSRVRKPVAATYARGSETSRAANASASSGRSSAPRAAAEADASAALTAVASQNTRRRVARRRVGPAPLRQETTTVHAAAPWATRNADSATRHGVFVARQPQEREREEDGRRRIEGESDRPTTVKTSQKY
jgi:hypothetical protein